MNEAAQFQDLVVLLALAVVAPLIAHFARRVRVSPVVIEICFGIVVGPQILGWVDTDGVIDSFAVFGLALLFFLAGFEIDPARLRGQPVRLASGAWLGSLALGLAVGGILATTGVVIDNLLVGLALTTTALGALLPILRDNGELDNDFGRFASANGALGEFAPIVALGILFAGDSPLSGTLILLGFLALIGAALGLSRVRRPERFDRMLRSGLHSSNQLPVRLCLLLVALLVWIAAEVGLDLLLGAFAAGLIIRFAVEGNQDSPDVRLFSEKLEAIGFGVFIPIFFVATGVRFDVEQLFESWWTVAKVPIFTALLLLARALPVWVAHRRVLGDRSATALALYSATALPLIVAITTIGVETERMRVDNATALVAAGMVSVLVFPVVAAALRRTAVAAPDKVVSAP